MIAEKLIQTSLIHLGKPYIWGANGPDSFDCSGFVLACLKACDLYPANIDTTAQDLFFYLSNQGWPEKKERGAVCFFGKAKDRITHVGFILNEDNFVGANGGNAATTTLKMAQKIGAKVSIKPIRKDLVACLYPREFKRWIQ